MYYASFGILAVIHHLIINREAIKYRRQHRLQGAYYRYGQFLIAIFVFYIADFMWGFLVDSKLRLLAYADTSLFFASMAISVLLWTRFVVAFVDAHGFKANIFIAAGWLIFGFVILHLVVNIFNPIIFKFTEDVEYIPGSVRYIILVAQLILFVSISIYSFCISGKREGSLKRHYRTIGLSGGVMALFIVIQSFFPFAPFYTIGCLFANCLVHVFVEEDEKKEQERIVQETNSEKERYSQIANSLARDYEAIYFIEIESGKYFELSVSKMYESMNVPQIGENFYLETTENVKRYVHPDDRHFAESMYSKEVMLKNLEDRKSYTYKYRVMVDGQARYFSFFVMRSDDGKHFILCDKDINDAITAETALLEKQKTQITFTHIAESLASNYDLIFYVDATNGSYVGYSSGNNFGELQVEESGDDFFDGWKRNMEILLHPEDRDGVVLRLDRDYLLTALDRRKQFNLEYRILINGNEQYTRLTARKTSDGKHLILGVENIDEEARKEIERAQALSKEKEYARRDELTGVKNKLAFDELEESVQDNLDKNMYCQPFALVVCDLNDLKKINDTKGHKAGDEYIKSSAKLLCDVFDHSPVFRIGGDEFAIYLSGDDYSSRNQLVGKIHSSALENMDRHEGPVIAIGMSEYMQGRDTKATDIFERADHLMYEDKKYLKSRTGT